MSGQRHSNGAMKWLLGLALALVLSGAALVCAGCQDLDSTTSSLTSTTAGTSTTTSTTTTVAESGDADSGSDDTAAPSGGGAADVEPEDDDPEPAESSDDSLFTLMSFVDRPIEYLFDEDDNGDPKTMRVGDSFNVRLRYAVADEVADYTMSIHEPSITRFTGDGLTRDPATMFYTEIILHFEAAAPGSSAVVILLRHEDGDAFRVWQIGVQVTE